MTVTATPDPGWKFVNWGGDLNSSANPAGVLQNESNPDNDNLNASLIAGPLHGSVSLNANGSFVYTPDNQYHGSDSFTYAAWDGGKGGTTGGAVTLTISQVNDLPAAVADAFKVSVGNTLHVAAPGVLFNDTDLDGTETFYYQISDGNGGTATGTVSLTVRKAAVKNEGSVTGRASDASRVSTSGEVLGVSGQLYLATISTKAFRSVNSMTGLGLAWTRVLSQCSGRNQTGIEVWMAKGDPSVSGTITAQRLEQGSRTERFTPKECLSQ